MNKENALIILNSAQAIAALTERQRNDVFAALTFINENLFPRVEKKTNK